jgi:hypothetical protein
MKTILIVGLLIASFIEIIRGDLTNGVLLSLFAGQLLIGDDLRDIKKKLNIY